MKVLLVNGSPHAHGATAAALELVAKALQENGIETQLFFLGTGTLADCTGCGQCRQAGKCVIDDGVNQLGALAAECDGFVFGSPVYYAHASARLLAAMDRVFYAFRNAFQSKPAAAVVTARRAGATEPESDIQKHFGLYGMPIVTSSYWNHTFGSLNQPGEQDAEGRSTMENLGRNMAWLLKCIDLGKRSGLTPPENPKAMTNFIR